MLVVVDSAMKNILNGKETPRSTERSTNGLRENVAPLECAKNAKK